jgi:anti-anti-sigma regulatory factor
MKAGGDVIVDLSELVFADTSLMLDLAALARRLRSRGAVLRLRGPQPQIRILIELVGLHRLAGVKLEGPTPALA